MPTSNITCLVDKVLDKLICEAYGRSNLATKTIEISAGTHGIIELNVCKNCVSKSVEVLK